VNSGGAAGRLCPLPIRPGPAAGEPADAYIRRLALANHLRPSYLRGYLAGPPSYLGAIQPERLAVLSGRTVAVLERTLTGLARHARPTAAAPQPAAPRPHTRAADKPALFAAIRRDAQDGYPIRTLAARYRVHRRMIRQALAGPAPPPRRQPPQRATALDRPRGDHDAGISYDRVHHYVIRLRPENPGSTPARRSQRTQARSTETTPAAMRP